MTIDIHRQQFMNCDGSAAVLGMLISRWPTGAPLGQTDELGPFCIRPQKQACRTISVVFRIGSTFALIDTDDIARIS